MRFKIKHEEKIIQITALVSFLLIFVTAFIPFDLIRVPGIIITVALSVISALLYFIEQAVGTVISVEDSYISVKHLFIRKKIDFYEISDVNIERYERSRKQGRYGGRYTEYRMRMTISMLNDKDIVLTDTATTVRGLSGFLLNRHERLDDDEVHIYQAYQMICSCTGR